MFQYNFVSVFFDLFKIDIPLLPCLTHFIFYTNILSFPNKSSKTVFSILPPIKGIKYKRSVSRLYILPCAKSVSIHVKGIIVPIGNYYLHIYLLSY